MGRIEDLAVRYRSHIGAPWQRNLAGVQKTIFVVYPKTEERKLRARIDLFEMATTQTQHSWRLVDITDSFACWMSELDYNETYFEEPESRLSAEKFVKYVADRLRQELSADEVDNDTVVAIKGVSSLFGFTPFSDVLGEVVDDIKGRLLVFFPGEYENYTYRLLDAGDGWNYLAVPITLHNGVND